MRGRVSAMSDEKAVSINTILKNALDWKQWMVDDLKLLLEVSRNEQLSDKALHALIMHHLKTYTLVNQSYSHIIGDSTSELFELPNLDYLKDILPGLDLANTSVDTVIEPMLELELDGLSKELREETLNPGVTQIIDERDDLDDSDDVDVDIDEDLEDVDDLDESDETVQHDVVIDDSIDDDSDVDDEDSFDHEDDDDDNETENAEDYDDDAFDEDNADDDIDDDFEDDIPKIVDIQESKVETKDLVGKLWDNIVLDDVKLGLGKGDVDSSDGH